LKGLAHLLLEATAFTLGEATPNAEALIVLERILKAFIANRAGLANALRFSGRSTLFWEERVRICLGTQCLILPFLFHSGEQVVKAQPFYKGIPLAIVVTRRIYSAR